MKNFIPRGNKTRKERIRKVNKFNSFSVCAFGVMFDINLNLIYRTLSNFAGKEMFIVGAKNWHRGATNGVEEIIPITYFNNTHSFLEHIKKTSYNMVCVEQTEKSVSLHTFIHPENPCFIFGSEAFGLTDDILLNTEHIVEIPMYDYVHPSLNVGVSSGIVIYDYINKIK